MLSRLLHRLWYGLLILCISFIIFFAITISAMRMLLPKLQHHAYLERVTSQLLKSSVHIGQVDTGWYGLQPRLILHHVALFDRHSGDQQLAINRLVIQINLLSSLVHWQLLPSQLTIDGASLVIKRNKQGQYFMQGLRLQPQVHSSTRLKSVVYWLLTQAKINIVHVQINFLQKIQLNNISLHLQNDFFAHHLYGAFMLAGKKHTHVKLIADLANNNDSLQHINGNIYLSVEHFSNATFNILRPLLPQFGMYHLEHLSGGARLWLGISDNHITSVLVYYALNYLQTTKLTLHNALGKFAWSNTQHQNYIQLENQQAYIAMPTVFNRPVQLGRLVLNAYYKRHQTIWQFRVSKLMLVNPVLTLNAQLQLIKHKELPLTLDVLSGFRVDHLSELKNFIPTKLLKPHLASWFQQAFLGGYLRHGLLVYRGPLAQSAFHQHHAQFELCAQLHKLKFSYAPHWPIASEGEVGVKINKNQLSFKSNHIKSVGNFIDQLHGELSLHSHSTLKLSLHTASTLDKGWKYIEATSLPLARQLQYLKFNGPMDLKLNLNFPLYGKSHRAIHTAGLIKIMNGTLLMPKWGLDFGRISGVLAFHNKQLFDTGSPLHAVLFDHPIQIHVKTVTQGQNRTLKFNSSGLLSVSSLRNHFPLPLSQFFIGTAKFAADLALHHLAAHGDDIHIATNLVGVHSQGLPSPFNKKMLDKRSLKIDVSMRPQKPLYLKLHYADLAAAAFIYDKTKKGLRFRSGDIELGNKAAHFMVKPGLIISGILAKLNWADWQEFLGSLLKSQQTTLNSKEIALRSVSLYVKQLTAYHHQFQNTHLTLTPLDTAWQVGLINKQINGLIIIPHNHKKLWILQCKYLHVPKIKFSHATHINPALLPPLQVSINDFSFGDHYYGKLFMQTQPLKNGLMIKQLRLGNVYYDIVTHGSWTNVGTHQYTVLLGGLHTNNLGSLLHYWKKSTILGGQGELDFLLQWVGSPLAIHWKNLTGTVSFNFKNGSLVALDRKTDAEIGLGRLLNLLSIDAIVKRLETHFRDLTQKGLWFDHFKGVWGLDHGIATTHKTFIDGPVAKIRATGNLNLAQRQADIQLDVMPQLTSSLPVIVGIFGGPIAGAATWMVNKIIGSQINKLSESRYQVTGPWKHLKISELESK